MITSSPSSRPSESTTRSAPRASCTSSGAACRTAPPPGAGASRRRSGQCADALRTRHDEPGRPPRSSPRRAPRRRAGPVVRCRHLSPSPCSPAAPGHRGTKTVRDPGTSTAPRRRPWRSGAPEPTHHDWVNASAAAADNSKGAPIREQVLYALCLRQGRDRRRPLDPRQGAEHGCIRQPGDRAVER